MWTVAITLIVGFTATLAVRHCAGRRYAARFVTPTWRTTGPVLRPVVTSLTPITADTFHIGQTLALPVDCVTSASPLPVTVTLFTPG